MADLELFDFFKGIIDSEEGPIILSACENSVLHSFIPFVKVEFKGKRPNVLFYTY